MLDFDTAQSRLAAAGPAPTTTQEVPLTECHGRILAQSVTATLDLPPSDNSAMDGYAIRHADYQAGGSLPIQQRCYAGDTPEALEPGKTIRLYTGSVMPEGADTVVMQENVTEANEQITINQAPTKGSHVRYQGEDVRADTEMIAAGTKLDAGEIALLASQGMATVTVFASLKIGLLTTGDELAQPGQPRTPEQIYNSNSPMLAALIARLGAKPHRVLHAVDTPEAITKAFQTLLDECDLVLTVGGVSVGDKDLVKPTIEQMGGTMDLWRVRMKPGRPVALAHAQNKPIVCLPGNPVSAYVVFALLVAPLIRTMQGRHTVLPSTRYGRLATTRTLGGSREEFLRVRVHGQSDAMPTIEPHTDQGSAIINSLAWANALARVPADSSIADGDTITFYELAECLA